MNTSNQAPQEKTKNVFAGTPDARQGGNIPVSRFRPQYRALTPDEKQLHDDIKSKAEELESLFLKVGAGRYASLAITDLEKSVMWAIKQLTW